MKDGWHTIKGYRVYVEENKIIKGIKEDNNNNEVTAYPYRYDGKGGWDNCTGVSVNTFINSGLYKLK